MTSDTLLYGFFVRAPFHDYHRTRGRHALWLARSSLDTYRHSDSDRHTQQAACRGCDAYGIEDLCKDYQIWELSRHSVEILPAPEIDPTQTADHKDDTQTGGDALPTQEHTDAQPQTAPAIDPKQKHHACALTHALSSDTPSLFAILVCMLALLAGYITLRKKVS